ncbi:hypothetical protein BDW74DRAFT_155061 [Aspergillus multicolor]|uniref:uncharacterized protein n=1 Tax=Aspergillus multicolor TaxID=41759 RepID=UPI003CCDF436
MLGQERKSVKRFIYSPGKSLLLGLGAVSPLHLQPGVPDHESKPMCGYGYGRWNTNQEAPASSACHTASTIISTRGRKRTMLLAPPLPGNSASLSQLKCARM